ncbi:MAG: histidine kinase [Bacteroides sp.]|nr:histidine kinase [Bacteroides sp.]MCM1378885.1 histidine kinase [Bacteroides sp.]MCM1445501.1 histidine kinase [Prevotella sp.]
MSNKELQEFQKLIQIGLDKAYLKMLQEKAIRGLSVARLDSSGNVVQVPAAELLAKYQKTK